MCPAPGRAASPPPPVAVGDQLGGALRSGNSTGTNLPLALERRRPALRNALGDVLGGFGRRAPPPRVPALGPELGRPAAAGCRRPCSGQAGRVRAWWAGRGRAWCGWRSTAGQYSVYFRALPLTRWAGYFDSLRSSFAAGGGQPGPRRACRRCAPGRAARRPARRRPRAVCLVAARSSALRSATEMLDQLGRFGNQRHRRSFFRRRWELVPVARRGERAQAIAQLVEAAGGRGRRRRSWGSASVGNLGAAVRETGRNRMVIRGRAGRARGAAAPRASGLPELQVERRLAVRARARPPAPVIAPRKRGLSASRAD